MWEKTDTYNGAAYDSIANAEFGTMDATKDVDGSYVNENQPLVQKPRDGFTLLSVSFKPPYTPLNILAISYSIVPFPLVVGLFIAYLVTGQLAYIYLVLQLGIGAGFSEAILKKIFKEARPAGSLLKTYGFPSSHSLTAVCVITYCTAEIFDSFLDGRILGPVALAFLLLVWGLLAPIPWARWYIEDHSLKQVAVGSGIGLFVGVVAYVIRVRAFPDGAMQLWWVFPF